MILLDRVSKRYSLHATPALDNVSLQVDPGEFLFIIGRSGAGKSTLIRMLTHEETPDSGKIIVGGIDYDDLREKHIPHLRRRIGVVFQDFKLLPTRTVFENIAFSLEIVGASNSEIKRTVPKIIDLVGLTGKENQFPDQIAGGEKQRVAIARSVARQPKILIADEPTANLDPETSREIMALLTKINQLGTTVLVTTHNQVIVNEFGSRVVTIRDGRIIVDQKEAGKYQLDVAEPVRIVRSPGHAVKRNILGDKK